MTLVHYGAYNYSENNSQNKIEPAHKQEYLCQGVSLLKIAFSSKGATLESMVDQKFARADWFIIVDTRTDEYRAFRNAQNLKICQDAGILAAKKISGYGVAALITGNCGPKAFWELGAAGVKVFYSTGGTIAEVLEKFKNGSLKEATKASV